MNPTEATPFVNYKHYIQEGWSRTPKHTFLCVIEAIKTLGKNNASVLDIGCGQGEFISLMANQFSDFQFLGIDIFDDLINKACELSPQHKFQVADFLEMDKEFENTFDIITGVGVLSLFSGERLEHFWQNCARFLKPGGTVLILGPVNELGIDMDLKHRKWVDGKRLEWETGWSIPSQQTIEESLKQLFEKFSFSPFVPQLDLSPKSDPIRTWTVAYRDKPRQLTNGLKLLVDLSLIQATKKI